MGKLFPFTRAGHSATNVGDYLLLIFGGFDATGKLGNELYLLDTRMLK